MYIYTSSTLFQYILFSNKAKRMQMKVSWLSNFFTLAIGSKSLYCIYFGPLGHVFFTYNFPKPEPIWWNLEYKWGPRFALTQEERGKSPQVFRPRVPKRVLL